MKFINQSVLSSSDKMQVLELWNIEYPEKLMYHSPNDFDNYLNSLRNQSHILLLDDSAKIQGWYFDFIRDGEKWFAIILDSSNNYVAQRH